MTRGRGRPRKLIDTEILFSMIRENKPIAAIARHLKINKDTIYANYWDVIKAGRAALQDDIRRRVDEELPRLLAAKAERDRRALLASIPKRRKKRPYVKRNWVFWSQYKYSA